LLTECQSLVRRCVGGVGARGGLQSLTAGQRASGRRSTRGASGTSVRCSRARVRSPSEWQGGGRGCSQSVIRSCVDALLAWASAGSSSVWRPSRRRPGGAPRGGRAARAYNSAACSSDRRAIRLGWQGGGLGVARRSSIARASTRCCPGRPRRPPAFGGRPEGVRAALHAGGRAARAYDSAVRASDRRAIRLGGERGGARCCSQIVSRSCDD
jgi:hypothetical protein